MQPETSPPTRSTTITAFEGTGVTKVLECRCDGSGSKALYFRSMERAIAHCVGSVSKPILEPVTEPQWPEWSIRVDQGRDGTAVASWYGNDSWAIPLMQKGGNSFDVVMIKVATWVALKLVLDAVSVDDEVT